MYRSTSRRSRVLGCPPWLNMTPLLPNDRIAKLSPSPSSPYASRTVKPMSRYQSTVARTSGKWIIGTTFSAMVFSSRFYKHQPETLSTASPLMQQATPRVWGCHRSKCVHELRVRHRHRSRVHPGRMRPPQRQNFHPKPHQPAPLLIRSQTSQQLHVHVRKEQQLDRCALMVAD